MWPRPGRNSQTFDRKLPTEEQQDTYDIYQFQIDLDSKLREPKF